MKKLLFMIMIGLLLLSQDILSAPSGEVVNNNFIGDGLTGHYYQEKDTTGGIIHFDSLTEAFSRTDTIVDFWNGDRYYRFEPVAGWWDDYSVEWNGYIYIEETGEYGFGTISDDGSQIFIDSVLIVDNKETQWYDWEDNISEGDTSGTPFPPLVLDSGFYDISVRFYENAYYDGIEFWWLKPGSGPSDIPYYGTNFHGTPPTYNPNTNWELVPTVVLFTNIDTITSIHSFAGEKPLPDEFHLSQNYPNPFNPSTTLRFQISPQTGELTTLKIYDVLGREIKTLVNEELSPGSYQVEWNGKDSAGQPVSSGIYSYRLHSGNYSETRKMILMR
jgi:hypothetical protein